jgi:membrane protease YdiL (CAAX protease family)
VLVNRTQNGDWTSLGITKSPQTPMELVKGFGFGLLLLGIWSGVAYMLSGGEMEMDALVTSLIGDTSEIGLVLAAIVLVIGAPVIEEIYYRGMLYEKFARRGRWPAVIGTSILFVAAHGALIIPALMVLAVGLGLARGRRPLWFTIGAHAGWNFAVVIIAAQLVFSPAGMFSPANDAYTLRLPTGWQQLDSDEFPPAPGGTIDLLLTTGSGAAMSIVHMDIPPGMSAKNIKKSVPMMQSVMPGGGSFTGLKKSDYLFQGYPTVYEIGMEMPFEGISAETRMVMALPRRLDHAYVFMLVCPANSCADNETEFDALLRSVVFNH